MSQINVIAELKCIKESLCISHNNARDTITQYSIKLEIDKLFRLIEKLEREQSEKLKEKLIKGKGISEKIEL